MNEQNLPEVVNYSIAEQPPVKHELLRSQVNEVQKAMASVMKDGTHFGKIPGCGDKPALLKPGAEVLSMMFRLVPTFDEVISSYDDGHREYKIKCTIRHLNGTLLGQGVGSCSTLESKYRWREQQRQCPTCKARAIIKGNAQYGGGWVCWKKKEGCGAKFQDGDPIIESQPSGRMENPDIADQYNTVYKMAKKRAHVDAVLTVTAASDIFTQDIEEMSGIARSGNEGKKPEAKVRPSEKYTFRFAPYTPEQEAFVIDKLIPTYGGEWHTQEDAFIYTVETNMPMPEKMWRYQIDNDLGRQAEKDQHMPTDDGKGTTFQGPKDGEMWDDTASDLYGDQV